MSNEKTLATIKELRLEIRKAEKKRKADRTRSKDPKESYHNGTWIYIATISGDSGNRPITEGTNFWNSPAIALFDEGAEIVANQMKTGRVYEVRVQVSNGGDTYADTCHVDLYICDPSLGFTREAGTLIGTEITAISPMESATVSFAFKAGPESIGHRCLFAMAYNLATNDFPENAGQFSPVHQRHTAQQNISIITGSEIVPFNVINTTGGNNLLVEVRQRSRQFDRVLAIPQLKKMQVQTKQIELLPELVQFDSPRHRLQIIKDPSPLEKELKRVVRLNTPVKKAPAKDAPSTPLRLLAREGTAKIGKWKMVAPAGKPLLMGLRFPKIKLGKQEVVVFDVELRNPDTKQVVGGITLVYRN